MNTPPVGTAGVLDLEHIWIQRSLLELSLDTAQRDLTAAQEALNQFETSTKAAMQAAFAAGQSTGNPLQDELLAYYGPNLTAIERALAFNCRLQANIGEEILLIFERYERICWGGSARREDFSPNRGYALGVLGTGRLCLSRLADRTFVVIPCTRHVRWGLLNVADVLNAANGHDSVAYDNLTLGCTLGEADWLPALDAIVGIKPRPASFEHGYHPPGTKVTILVGKDEIGIPSVDLSVARGRLYAASPAEMVQGEGI
jgi:hypothetical protein